eukprot:EG_transcript_1150
MAANPLKSPRSEHQFTMADFTCPICMELLCSPRTPRCGHTFCEHCLQAWFDNTPSSDSSQATCPVDRHSLPIAIPDVSILLQELIRQAFPAEYARRERAVQELRHAKLLRDLRFIFCRSAHNADLVARLGADEHGYLRSEALVVAMLHLPRGEFLPPALREDAHDLRPSRIETLGFNVSAPNMYSFCLEQLRLGPGHRFLDIGSGCGLLTALAAQLVGRAGVAHGIDVRTEIVAFARRNAAIQRRRVAEARRQREAHRTCPNTAALVPGSVFVGTCSEQAGRTKYPAKLIIDHRQGNEIEARFYWQTFGKTVTRLEGSVSVEPGNSGKDVVRLELKEVQVMSTRLDRILWLPCWYSFSFDPKAGKLVGNFGTSKTLSSGATSLTMTHLQLPDDELQFDSLEFHEVNCFRPKAPLTTVLWRHGGYDRIHCGATCPLLLLPRLERLLAPGGIMVLPVDGAMLLVEKNATTGVTTHTPVLPVRYGDLEVPPDLPEDLAEDPIPEQEPEPESQEPPPSDVPPAAEGTEPMEAEDRPKKRKLEDDGAGPRPGAGLPSAATEGAEATANSHDDPMEDAEHQSPAGAVPAERGTAPTEAPTYVYYARCCGTALVEAGQEVSDDYLRVTIGGVLELPDGEAVLCRKASNLELDDFQYVSELLQGHVRNVRCRPCGRHLGVQFIGEPPERGEGESYTGAVVLVRAYLRDKPREAAEAAPEDAVSCQKCSAQLSTAQQVLSTDHQWTLERAAESHPEKAAYLNWIDPEAVVLGEEKQARMTQGTSKYATVCCKTCGEELGWKFLQHVHPHERIRLAWFNGRFGLVLSKVKGIRVEQPMTLTLTQLMRHLQLVGLFRHSSLLDDPEGDAPTAELHNRTFTITGVVQGHGTDADPDDEAEEQDDEALATDHEDLT